jgi:large subunit ribosomal protein L9
VKVIFIDDVPNVARAGQTKVVADGYARNYLFPRKLAVLANSTAAAAVEAHLKKIVKQKAIEEAEMVALAKIIQGTELVLKAKVGENERLYGSVTGADIAAELSKVISREIDKRKVDLAEPIRQVGVYDITIRFAHDITAVVVVTAMSDEEGAVKPQRIVKKAENSEEPKEKVEKPPKEKKEKKEKPPKEVKEETAEQAEKEEKPAKEKKEKQPKAARAEKPEDKTEKPVNAEEKAEKVEKKEKKEKKEKPPKEIKEEKPGKSEKKAVKAEEPPKEEKKEKKPKAEKKPKKSEA